MPFTDGHDFYADCPDPRICELKQHWQRLALSSEQVDPACCGPAWNLSFHKIFNPANRIYYLSADDGLLLFSEHVTPENRIFLAPLEDSWMFGKPILGFFAPEIFSVALNQWHREYGAKIPPILLSGMREDDIPSVKFFLRFRTNFNFYYHQSMVECCASLRGGVEGWLSRRSSNHRIKLKKAARKASEYGIGFERHRPVSREAAETLYGRMLSVERRSWKGHEHCGMAETPSKEFYAELIGRQALDKSALVIFARLGDEDIGFIYGGICGPYYRGQQFSYDRNYAGFSLGNLMQWEKVRWLCELGVQRYDMGPITGPRMEYKSHWTEINRESQVWLMRQL